MSFKIDFEITDEYIAETKEMLNRYYNLEVDEAFVERVIRSDKYLAAEIFESGGCTDTFTREMTIDAVTRELLGKAKYWPSNSDKESEVQEFYKDLKEACEKNNLKFNVDL